MSRITFSPASGTTFYSTQLVDIQAVVDDVNWSRSEYGCPYIVVNGETFSSTDSPYVIIASYVVPSNVASFTATAYFYVHDEDDDKQYWIDSASATYYVSAGKCGPPDTVSVERTNVAPGTSVKLSWGAGTSGGGGNTLSGYNVYRSTSADGIYTKILSGVSSPQYVTSPSDNSSYYYKITAYGTRGGESDKSSAYATLTTTYESPTAPQNLTISETQVKKGSTIRLSWTAPESAGTHNTLAGYKVYFKDGAGSYDYSKSTAADTITTTHAVSNDSGVTRYFYVTAYGSISDTESPASNVVSVITKGGTIKYHNGTSWVECEVYYHNGSQWVECELRYHDGSSWREVSS